ADLPAVWGSTVAVVIETCADQHEIEVGRDHPVLQIPDGCRFVTVDSDLGVSDAMLGEDLWAKGVAHEGDQLVPVREVMLLADRLPVPADHVLGQRGGEVIPV